ncbi:MAG: CotH kinase family protein, partial [Eubacterium sp.]|nr:CotH kinase family protein [Eubacterium sp.]
MKKSVKRVVAIITATAIVVTMLLSVPFLASASSAPAAQNLESSLLKVWADPENVLTQDDVTAFNSGTKTALAGAVGIHKISSGSSYYMFLPSNADCTNLKFWFSSDTTVKIDGATLTSGQPTSVLSAINAGGISQSYSFTVGSSSYTVTAMKSGDVGAVYIDTNSGSISSINSSQDNSETGTIVVANPDGSVDYDGELAKMNGRGNASWNEVTGKKPYNIKLAESASLQGMPKAKKWSLIANDDGTDPSLLKNQIIYDFSDYIGIPYQVHSKPVDLYVNQQYFGCYQLTERVQIKSNRINITDAYENLEIANGTVDPATGLVVPKDLTGTSTNSVSSTNSGTVGQKEYSSSLASPSDYTGGYVYELEISQRWVEENAGFCAYNGQGWTIKNCDYVSKDMCDYSYDLLYALGGAVYNGGIVPSTSVSTTHKVKKTIFSSNETKTNPAPAAKYQGKKWSDLLDANSAVLFYWVQEYFQNLDASTTSNYFFKDSDSIDGK